MNTDAPRPFGAIPNARQLAWQEMGMYAFLHFTVNTFTGREWGDGTEDESLFAPDALDCDQWCRVLSEAGFQGAILTAKHHDGFCLWPSAYTDHSVKNSRWRDGTGDVVGEFVRAAKKYGLKVGFYLSPWDRHDARYGTGEEYNAYFANQLRELLETYGGEKGEDVFITWFDGACGEGPNGKVQRYDYHRAYEVIRRFAPKAVIMGHMGDFRDIRWCGNEGGHTGETNWATIDGYQYENLRSGTPGGRWYWPSEVDVSIRPGWFHHPSEDPIVRSLEWLVDCWFQSVGRGACLNLDLPPDRHGRICEIDARRVRDLKTILDRAFATDLAAGATVSTSNERGASFSGAKLVDGNRESYWATDDDVLTAEAVVELPAKSLVNVIKLREHSQLGERVSSFEIDYRDGEGAWRKLLSGTTISFRRILRAETVETDALRLRITGALASPCIEEFGAYHMAPALMAPAIKRDPDGFVTLSCRTEGGEIRYTLDGSEPNEQSPRWTKPFPLTEGGTVRALASFPAGVEDPYGGVLEVPRSQMRFGLSSRDFAIIDCDGEVEGHPVSAIFGDGSNLWLTEPTGYPHHVTVDMGRERLLSGFLLLPAANPAWALYRFRFLVGETPGTVDRLILEDSFDNAKNHAEWRTVSFRRPVRARYYRFEILEPLEHESTGVGVLEVF